MKKLICTFLLLFTLQIITGRTIDSFIFKQISIDHGLTNSKVISIHRDLDGFLWVGTEDGLNRINQSMVKTYRFDYNDSIRGNHIHFISEDYNKNLWIGTDKGLLRYNRNTDNFEKTEFSQYIYTGCLSEKDQIIFKAYDHLLILKAGSPEFIKFSNNKLHHNTTNILRKDNDHLIITGFWQGVYECNLKSGHLRGISMNTSLACTSVTMDNNKNFWFGFYGSGLICCDQNLQYKTNILFNQESDSHDNLIMDLKADKEGLIWAITDGGGLKLLNPETYEYRSFEHTYGVKGSLPVNNLFTTYIDTNNNIWLGSISGGIIGVDKSKIQSFQEGISNSDYGLSHNIVSSFAKSEDYIWIGTDGNGINRFNPQTNKFKHYANTFKLPISSIIDWNDQFLMTTFYNKGIYLFDKLKGEYFIIRELDKINNEIRNTQVSPGLYKLDDESIFIASTESYYYNFISKRLINLSKQDKVIHHPSIRLAGEDKHYLYLYDSNKIIIYNKLKKSLKQHTRFKLTELGHIKCMSFDQSSGFWFVTRKGLYNYNGNSKRLFYHKIPGINDPTSIIQIEKSIIGIGDKRKFIVYNSDKGNTSFYDHTDGLLINEYTRRGHFVDNSNNAIYLGGINGMSIIPLDRTLENNLDANIILSSVFINGEKIKSQRKINGKQEELEVSAGVSKLQFQLNNVNGNVFKTPVFRYRLSGFEKSFQNSSDYIIDYYNLNTGTYKLQVQYQLGNGQWSSPHNLCQLEILPHWWDTWIFKLLITLIFIALIFAYYYKNKKNQERKLEQRIRNYEKDMYQKKIQFFESINHELRTPLTLITGPINRLINNDKSLSDETINTLQKVSNQTDYMKHVINMVLDIRKLDQGITEINYKLTNLVEFIDTIRLEFGDSYDQKGVLLSFQHTLSNEMVWIDQLKIKIILVNLLSNALKFSEPESHVSIVLVEFENNIEISVNDEGAGLKDVDLDNLFNSYYQGKHDKEGNGIGLYYSRMLINLIGGEIKARNNVSGGATFTILIPRNLSVEESDYSHQEYYVKPKTEYCDYTKSDNFTILLVEDIPEMQHYLAEELRSASNQVIVAGNGKEAAEILKSQKIDLVVSDIMMPVMDGYELCSLIKKDIELSHIPIILLTALCDNHNIKTGYNCGANAYLAKPFDSEALISLIQTLMRQQLLLKKRFQESCFAIVPDELVHSNLDKIFIDKLLQLINEHIEQPELDVDFICDKMAVSRSALYSKMKNYIGKGVKELINDIRLEKAKNLLKQTDLPISEIAFKVGFAQQRYFSRVFKQEVGMTPSEYRTNKSE